GRGHGRAVQGLDAFGAGDGGLQAAGDVGGDVRAAHRQAVDVHQRAVGEHRDGGRAAAHVDADAAEVHLVVLDGSQGGDEGGGDHAFELQVGAFDAVAEGLVGGLADRHHQQLEPEYAAEHRARVAHAL